MLYTTRLLLIGMLLLGLFEKGFSQSTTNYLASTGVNANLNNDRNNNPIDFTSAANLIGVNSTSANSALTPIGFDVVFMGKLYTHFIAGNDGQVGLSIAGVSASVLSGSAANDLTRTISYPPSGTNDAPVLAAFWDDLRTARSGATVQTTITGTAPNRCRIIQWNAVINSNSSTVANPADGQFQLRIYESTGDVEYVYGKMTIGSSSGNVTASIGFTAGVNDNEFIALQNLSTYAFTRIAVNEPATQNLISSSVPQTIFSLHSTSEGNRRYFCFSSVQPSGAFGNISASSSINATTLSWTDNFTNELGYVIYRSVDNINFSAVATLTADIHSYTATNLTPGTLYYWKVYAHTEGALSTPITTSAATVGCSMSGIYKVGPTGTFATLTQAIDTLKKYGLADEVVLELQANYNSSAEIFPIAFPQLSCASTSRQLIVRPEAGAARTITSSNSMATIMFDGARYVRLDGRAGGVGDVSNLQVINTHIGGPAVRFINDASFNQLKYMSLRGINASDTSGVLVFGGTALVSGNDDNVIDSTNIYDASATPVNLIYAHGTIGKNNDRNIISNCNLYNFFNNSKGASGIYLSANNHNYTITRNSIYQTVARDNSSIGTASLGPDVNGIRIATTGTGNHIVSYNYIGGTAPNCGGSKMHLFGNMYFTGINVSDASGLGVQVLNNVVDNIYYHTINIQMTLTGIGVRGNFSSVIRNNRIGSNNDSTIVCNGNYYVQNSGFVGINAAMSNTTLQDSLAVDGNIISGIYANSAGGGEMSIRGLYVGATRASIRNNIIGTPGKIDAIVNASQSTLTGIYYWNSWTNSQFRIHGNHITGLTMKHNGAWSTMKGIKISSGTTPGLLSVFGNVIEHLYSASVRTSSIEAACLGIECESNNTAVYNNTIRYLYNLNAAAAGSSFTGIVCNNPLGGSGSITVNNNLIHTIGQSSNNLIRVCGIELLNGTQVVYNNIIRLGLDSSGNSITKGFTFYGISDPSQNTAVKEIYHNSVYIGGSNVTGGSNSTAAFHFNNTGARVVVNNIFANTRSNANAGASGKHYAILCSTLNNSNTLNYNIYHAPGTDGILGKLSSNDYNNIAAWRAATQKDANSHLNDPNFVNAGAAVSSMNLHLASPTIAEGTGTNSSTPFTDFDGEIRNNLTPVDIGADAGNYVLLDVFSPAITVPVPIANTGEMTDQVVTTLITDQGSGVNNFTFNERPKIWFRKKAGNVVSNWVSDYGLLQSGNTNNGVWSFTISYSLLNTPVDYNDTIEYYFIAQDTTTPVNIGIFPSGGSHTDVNNQVSAPQAPLWYKILPRLDSVMNVGSGHLYTSLTGTGGLFEAITNSGGLSGNTIISVTSDLAETGLFALNGAKQNGFSITIKPDAGIVRVITGSNILTDMIKLQGVKKLTIDGSHGGGRYLRFVNTGSGSNGVVSTMLIENGCDSVSIRNCIIEANTDASSTKGNIVIGSGANKNILIYNNLIGNTAAGITNNAVFVNGALNKVVIRKNEVFNFRNYGIRLHETSDGAVVDSNSIYYYHSFRVNENVIALQVRTGNGHTIKANYIGGSESNAGGTPWMWTNSQFYIGIVKFIAISVDGVNATTGAQTLISQNVFKNFKTENGDYLFISGIYTGGNVSGIISDNKIGDVGTANAIVNTCRFNINGITNTIGIENKGSGRLLINDNVITNLINQYEGGTAGLAGIVNHPPVKISNDIKSNHIYNLISYSSATGIYLNFTSSVMGVVAVDTRCIADIEDNLMHDLHMASAQYSEASAYGVRLTNEGPSNFDFGNFNRNRLYNITLAHNNTYNIYGVYMVDGNWNLFNNQISIRNGNHAVSASIYGIWNDNTDTCRKNIFNNTIYIGGNTATGAVAEGTCLADYSNNLCTTRIRNNIFYTEKQPGYRLPVAYSTVVPSASNPNAGFTGETSDYNLYITPDSSKLFRQMYTSGTFMNLSQWQSYSNGDVSSFGTSSAAVPSSQFFVDVTHGNLDLKTDNDLCWHANGKAIPRSNVVDDYGLTAIRSTNIINGASDLGSDEFNTTTTPLPLRITGNHIPGGTEFLSFNGKKIASITWSNTGTLPGLGIPRWYSGVWPNDTIYNATGFINGYVQIPATGGNGYNYSLTLYFDSSMHGKIQDITTMKMYKRSIGGGGAWMRLNGFVSLNNTITVSNLASFSDFSISNEMINFWMGTISADWNNPANWSSAVPSSTDNVYIPAGTPFSPAIPAGATVSIKTLTLPPGVVLTIGTGAVLNVGQ